MRNIEIKSLRVVGQNIMHTCSKAGHSNITQLRPLTDSITLRKPLFRRTERRNDLQTHDTKIKNQGRATGKLAVYFSSTEQAFTRNMDSLRGTLPVLLTFQYWMAETISQNQLSSTVLCKL